MEAIVQSTPKLAEQVYANALLSDGKILFWYTGERCTSPWDFNKDFYYAGINLLEYEKAHELRIVRQNFLQRTPEDNYRIFNEAAPAFYRMFEISPDSVGERPY